MQDQNDSGTGAKRGQPRRESARRHAGEQQRSESQTGSDAFVEDRFSADSEGDRGYRGRAPWHTPPGSVPGGSYGAGGGYQQGGYERGDWQSQGADEWQRGYGGYGVSGRGPAPESGWARPSGPADRESAQSPGNYGYRGQRRGEGWRGEGAWGNEGGPIRGTDEWYRNQDRHGGRSWTEHGPHTGRGPQGYERPEAAIRDDVCERLTRHGHVDASGITVRVEQNEVILEGEVDSRAAKRMAEDTAESVTGVRDVHNRLRVR